MKKLQRTALAGLGLALGLTGSLVGAPTAQAANASCRVTTTHAGAFSVHVQPYATATLRSCGTVKQLSFEVRKGNGPVQRVTYNSRKDGSWTSPLGVSARGTYKVRAVADQASSPWTTFQIVNEPTMATANQKFVGDPSNAWGTFDTTTPLKVWTEVRLPDGRWSTSQTGRTDARGRYVLPLTYGKDRPGVYDYRVAGRYPNGTVLRTPVRQLERIDDVVHATTAGVKPLGQTTYAWGSIDVYVPTEVWTEVRLPNGRWSRSQTRSTDSSGAYTIPLTYGARTRGVQTFRVGAVIEGRRSTSAPVRLRRVTAPTVASAGVKRVGQTTYTWGKFDPSGLRKIRTQVKLPNGRWSTSQTRTPAKDGRYTIPLTYGAATPGTYRWRVVGAYPEGTLVAGEFSLTRIR